MISTLSVLSQYEVDEIRYRSFSFEEALLYLNGQLQTRTFSQTLQKFYAQETINDALTQGLTELEASVGSGLKKESIGRNVRNWLHDQSLPDRENAIKICFALGFSEPKAKAFLSLVSDGAFHLRDPRDLVYCFGLRTGRSYAQCQALFASLKPLDPGAESETVLTRTLADSFAQITDEKSFRDFYSENFNKFGVMHNTAYVKCFLPWIQLLICPNVPSFFEKERRYSVEETVDLYLKMDVAGTKKEKRAALLPRTIRKYWPNASSITRMKGRREDVSRKVLLLLYLITGGQSDEQDDVDTWSAQEQFENHYWKLNAMLDDCGYSTLDPRNVFDWLVLYCLRAGEDELPAERLESLLDRIFAVETV